MFGLKSLFSPIFRGLESKKAPTNGDLRKLIGQNPPVEDVLLHDSFLALLNAPEDALIDYLSQQTKLRKIVDFIRLADEEPSLKSKSAIVLSQRASYVLGAGNLKISAALFINETLVLSFMDIIKFNWATHSTSQGYFLEICKSLLQTFDVQKKMILAMFENSNNRYLLMLIENMTPSNCSLLKYLVSDIYGLSFERRNIAFNYLVFYFLNNKFEEQGDRLTDELMFVNVYDFIDYLLSEQITFEYKKKYISNLFNVNSINSKQYFLPLLKLRLLLLKYLLKTKQLKEIENAGIFLQKLIEFSVSLGSSQLLKEALTFFLIASELPTFSSCLDTLFFVSLGTVFEKYPKMDVAHVIVVKITLNVVPNLIKSVDANIVLSKLFITADKYASVEFRMCDSLNGPSFIHLLSFADHMMTIGAVDKRIKLMFQELRTRIGKDYTLVRKKSIDASTYITRSEVPTLLKTNDDIAKLIDDLRAEEGPPVENFIKISTDVFSSRSSSNSQVLKRPHMLSAQEKEAEKLLESLVHSQIQDASKSSKQPVLSEKSSDSKGQSFK